MAGEGPRFRRDLDARPIEIDGVAYVDATDPRSGSHFLFYDFEHAVAEALDGRALGDVVSEARAKSGVEVTPEQLDSFIEKLSELGFLEPRHQLGDDDATLAGPPPAGILEATRTAPAPKPESAPVPEAEPVAAAASEPEEPLEEQLIPQGSTEKLPVIGSTEKLPVIGSTEKLPVLAARAETPSEELGPQEPDPALRPRSGELGAQPKEQRPLSPSAQLELEPPAEASVVAAELDEVDSEEVTRDLPRFDDPTKRERQPDERRLELKSPELKSPELKNAEHKNTLFGVPFHEVDQIVARARAGTAPSAVKEPAASEPDEKSKADEKTAATASPPVAAKSAEPAARRPQPTVERKPVGAAPTVETKPLVEAETVEAEPETKPDVTARAEKTTELVPLESAALEPAAVESAALESAPAPLPAAPFPPAPSVLAVPPFPPAETSSAPAASPFPPAATPAPQPQLAPHVSTSIEHPALALSSELPAVAPPTPKPRPVRLSPILFAAAGVLLAGTIGFYGFRWSSTSEPGPVAVRTITPTAGSTYRWFDGAGAIKPAGEHTLTFTAGGKVIRVMPAGTAFHAGDVIAEIEGGAGPYKQALEHNRQRLAYYEKRLEQMTADNNKPEMRQAELKIAEKKRLIAEAQAGLSKQGVVASAPGEVAEVVAAVGTEVKPGSPAVRTKGTDWRAEFELSRDDAERARHLGFCQLEVQGKQYECSLSADGGDETHVFVDIPADAGIPTDKPVHLAKARYDGVFVLPASALVPTKGSDRRVYVVKDGRAESYAVVLADQTPTEIVVTQGLEPGTPVIAEVPAGLRPRAVVKPTAK